LQIPAARALCGLACLEIKHSQKVMCAPGFDPEQLPFERFAFGGSIAELVERKCKVVVGVSIPRVRRKRFAI